MATRSNNTGRLERIRTDDPTLSAIQDNIQKLADQVQPARGAQEAYPCRRVTGGEQLGADTMTMFTGKGTIDVKLPTSDLLGRGKAFRLTIHHGGAGMLRVPTAGKDLLATGATSFTVSPGEMVICDTDGYGTWWVK